MSMTQKAAFRETANSWEAETAEASAPRRRLVSVSAFVAHLTTTRVLQHAGGSERMYWCAPGYCACAAFGVAAELFAWGEDRILDIERQARRLFAGASLPGHAPAQAWPRLMGGFAFRDDFVPDHTWAAFHPAHFILPHMQFVQTNSQRGSEPPGGWLTLNALVGEEENMGEVQAALREALQARLNWLEAADKTSPVSETGPVAETDEVCTSGADRIRIGYPMSFGGWREMIERALHEIHSGKLTKVVLSRVCELRHEQNMDVDAALSVLDSEYADCYRFLFEPRPGHAFLGATPELLVRVNGRALETMALAGSQRRGRDAAEDTLLERDLLNSAKDRHEHNLVLDELRARLRGILPQPQADDDRSENGALPHGLRVGETQVLKLRNIQHLFTPVQAQLRHADGVLPELALLHPTPALGGLPCEAANQFICAAEPVTRGWYAAPIGWLGANLDGEFAVAIRSAVVQRERAWLYSGCGIVAGSDPQKEWDETALKFKPMLRALTSPVLRGERAGLALSDPERQSKDEGS